MKWLAKINLGVVIERLGTFKSALILITVIALSVFTGYRVGNYYHHFQVSHLEQQKFRLEKLYQQEEGNLARIHALEVELTIEQLANIKAQALLKKSEKEKVKIKTQLAFYEKVMTPEKEVTGLLIDDATIIESVGPHQYLFQVTLLQQQLKRRYSKGYIELSFQGHKKGKLVTLNLTEIAKITKKDLKFSFQYFQIIDGKFTLPADFIPEKIIVSAILTKSRWQKYDKKDKTLPWVVN